MLNAPEQLDLLDCIDGETRGAASREERRFASVLTCMRDAVPDTMRFVIDLWAPPRREWGAAGGWSYMWPKEAFIAVPRGTGAEEQSVTWDEFATIVEGHPARAGILAWEASLTATDKWRDLYRPNELWPYGLDDHPSNIAADHERAGWDERFTAWMNLYTILTDAIAQVAPRAAEFQLPTWEAQRPRACCRFCRAEVAAGSYAADLNHARLGDTCTSRALSRNHVAYAKSLLNPANRKIEQCGEHHGRKAPCPQACFEREYERQAARATEVWGDDDWKELARS
ncbi:hypothetical protein ACMZ29_00545 [Brevibacterium casei]|uniref:Uncharacterized protein n=1 Tax=Brevibacterium casei TaxID=33889 RepID=A0A7T2WN12_9MICO|nr:hypothetical protein [Brevibacterium casei]QPS33430.1 hypothetical protein I6G59_16090 [Brevibacterium casei]